MEPDQLMMYSKLSFDYLCSSLLTKCMNHAQYQLLIMFESICQLNGHPMLTLYWFTGNRTKRHDDLRWI